MVEINHSYNNLPNGTYFYSQSDLNKKIEIQLQINPQRIFFTYSEKREFYREQFRKYTKKEKTKVWKTLKESLKEKN